MINNQNTNITVVNTNKTNNSNIILFNNHSTLINYHNNISNYNNINNYNNISNHTLIFNNSHTKNNINIIIFAGILIGSLIIFCSIFNYLIHECNYKSCLNDGFGIYPDKIKKRIKDFFLSIYYFILNCYCYNDIDELEYAEVYDIRDVIIDIEVPNYNSNNIVSNYVYDEANILPFKSEKCSICLEITENEQITTECDHVFCKECIELYLKNNNTCPNCRNEIKKLYNNYNCNTI